MGFEVIIAPRSIAIVKALKREKKGETKNITLNFVII
jgi:hypothetical protein